MDPITRTLVILEWIFVKGFLIVFPVLLVIAYLQQARRKPKQPLVTRTHESANLILAEYHKELYSLSIQELPLQLKQNTQQIRASVSTDKQNNQSFGFINHFKTFISMTKGWQFWLSWLQLFAFAVYVDALLILQLAHISYAFLIVLINIVTFFWLWWITGYKAELKDGYLTVTAPMQQKRTVALQNIMALEMTSFENAVRVFFILSIRKNIRVYTRGSHFIVFTSMASNRREFTQTLIDAVKEANPDVAVSSELP